MNDAKFLRTTFFTEHFRVTASAHFNAPRSNFNNLVTISAEVKRKNGAKRIPISLRVVLE